MTDLLYFPLALGATLVLEGLVLLPLLRKGDRYFIAAFVLVNVITNVALNFLIGVLRYEKFVYVIFALGECAAVAIEYFVLKKVCESKYLFWFVLCANAVSALAGGALLTALFL